LGINGDLIGEAPLERREESAKDKVWVREVGGPRL
jgi:hypothetical protein